MLEIIETRDRSLQKVLDDAKSYDRMIRIHDVYGRWEAAATARRAIDNYVDAETVEALRNECEIYGIEA